MPAEPRVALPSDSFAPPKNNVCCATAVPKMLSSIACREATVAVDAVAMDSDSP